VGAGREATGICPTKCVSCHTHLSPKDLQMTREPLDRNLRIRLNAKEDNGLAWLAQKLGQKTRSRLVRKMIREALDQGPDLFSDDLKAWHYTVSNLGAIGRNLNQIARAANSGAVSVNIDPAWLIALETEIKAIDQRLIDTIKRCRTRWVQW
jgi:hypothetical protein